MSAPRLRVGRDTDGTWYVVHDRPDEDYAYPADWVAEGVGTWERAMFWACAYLKRDAA